MSASFSNSAQGWGTTFNVGGDGGYDDVGEKMDMSEEVSAGARIFRGL